MAAIDLTTLDKVKTELGNATGTGVDTLLSSLITAASRWFMTQTGRRIKSSTITKLFDGDATYGLGLPNGPVTDVDSVFIDGVFVPASDGPGSAGYVLRNDRIELVGYIFTTGVANVQVTYTSGFSGVPEDVEQAVIEMTCWMYRNRDHFGIQQRSVHDAEAITFRKDEVPFFVQITVDAYKTFMGITPFGGVEE